VSLATGAIAEKKPKRTYYQRVRYRMHLILEAGRGSGPVGIAFEAFLIVLIVANAFAVTIESVPKYGIPYKGYFDVFEWFSVAVFTVEYALRLWTAPDDPRFAGSGPLKTRLRCVIQPYMLIDFVAIAPAFLALFVPVADLRILRLFRLLRLLKIARYSPAVATLMHVLSVERRALFGTLLLTLCVMSLSGECMYIIEGQVQPNVFGSLPDCMYWAIITLTTVGYGDKVPVTLLGKALAGITAILGLGLFALPVGIIASGFMGELHRRDFVVTSGMLSRIPLFAGFDLEIMSELMIMLRSSIAREHAPIVVAGEPATAMYFIVSGQAKAEVGGRTIALGPGDFFGADALLRSAPYDATVFADTPMRVLTLSAQDLVVLLRKYPTLKKRLERKSMKREKPRLPADDLSETPKPRRTAS
jgi:voltage-gated potassium channel